MESKKELQGTGDAPMQPIPAQSVPADYASLGVACKYEPVPAEKLRMFIVGPSGEGKSTFISGSRRTIILDFERGAEAVPRARAHRIRVSNRDILNKIVQKLLEDASKPTRPYDRVVFDTIDQMAEMMNPELAADLRDKTKFDGTDITSYGDKGAGWAKLKIGCWDYVKRLEAAGYTWTVVGHITEKNITVNKSQKTVPRPVLFDSFARLIGRNCEVFASIYSEIREDEGPKIKVQGRLVQGPRVKVNKVFMDATTISSEKNTGQGKLRGIPTMTSNIFLPDPLKGDKQGWDVFTEEYTSAIEKVKAKL